jgi:hypothetical protein
MTERQQLSHSLIERSLGRFAGWQMTSGQDAATDKEVRSTSGAVLARVTGAPLGSTEADVLTWLLAQWVQDGCPADGSVRLTMYRLARALYGERASGGARRLAAEALTNLHQAGVTMTDYDPETGRDIDGRWVDLHLIQRIEYGEELRRLRFGGHAESTAALGGLRDESVVIHIDHWLIRRLQVEKLRAWLDWPVQRQLGSGIGKRLWLFLEPHLAFRAPASNPEVQLLRLELTDDVYAQLGANCKERRDNRKLIRRGMERIVEIDPRYREWRFKAGKAGAPDELLIGRRTRRSTDVPDAGSSLEEQLEMGLA